MAVPDWPAGVPSLPLLESHSIDPMLAPIRTEMEQGNMRRRARPGDDVAVVQQSVAMTKAQYDTLVAWGKSTIGNWTGRFKANVWLGSSCATKVCQFESAPKPSAFSARRISVAMSLRVYGV
jgi:hypothetical protein